MYITSLNYEKYYLTTKIYYIPIYVGSGYLYIDKFNI